jgi:leader peptidase (prepilin peptidase)/N-methyltransferase
MTWFPIVVAALYGALIGSFLNVVIHRYPREESVVFPASHCPHCDARIRAWDNVPLLSYLFLLGRCRACGAPISVRYPLVELATALFSVAVVLRVGLSLASVLVFLAIAGTIALIYIDAEIQILPDVIDLPGIAIGVGIGALELGTRARGLTLATSLADSLIGAAAGGGVLLLVAMVYKLVRGIDGMGLGDVKMLAMIGSVMGWRSVLGVLLLASLSGMLVGLGILVVGRRSDLMFALPFGVFLGFAFLTLLFFTERFEAWLPALRLAF